MLELAQGRSARVVILGHSKVRLPLTPLHSAPHPASSDLEHGLATHAFPPTFALQGAVDAAAAISLFPELIDPVAALVSIQVIAERILRS